MAFLAEVLPCLCYDLRSFQWFSQQAVTTIKRLNYAMPSTKRTATPSFFCQCVHFVERFFFFAQMKIEIYRITMCVIVLQYIKLSFSCNTNGNYLFVTCQKSKYIVGIRLKANIRNSCAMSKQNLRSLSFGTEQPVAMLFQLFQFREAK